MATHACGPESSGTAGLPLRTGDVILTLDQPMSLAGRVLSHAGLPISDEARSDLVRLVLHTPDLDRLIGGVVVTEADLHGCGGRAPAAAGALATAIPLGVRMGEPELLVRDADGSALVRSIARHAEAGASFGRWRIVTAGHSRDRRFEERCRTAAVWAAACQHGGLTPVVDCVVSAASGDGLDRIERIHSQVVRVVVEALHAAGADVAATVIGASVITPGVRRSTIGAQDIASVTLRSLRSAGAHPSGVLLTSVAPDPRMVAYMAATQWMRPEWPIGFCLGRSILGPAAQIWRGESGSAAAAQRHLASELTRAVAVLRVGRSEVSRRQGEAWWHHDEDDDAVDRLPAKLLVTGHRRRRCSPDRAGPDRHPWDHLVRTRSVGGFMSVSCRGRWKRR